MDKEKVLKILLIIAVLVFIALGIFTIYKFVIINKILNKMQEYVSIDNYYMKVIDKDDESGTMEIYYKDGIGKSITTANICTWTNGTEAYMFNEVTKKIQKVNMESPLLISNEFVASVVPGYSKSFVQKLLLASNLNTSVKVKNYDGIKYYVITTKENKVWFEYDSLLPAQANLEMSTVKKTYTYEINFDVVREDDVKKPNLAEYIFVD